MANMSELDRLDDMADEMVVAREFLEWVLSQGVIMDSNKSVSGTLLDTTKFVEQFFDIDPAKVEAERKELLKVARSR